MLRDFDDYVALRSDDLDVDDLIVAPDSIDASAARCTGLGRAI